MWKLSIRDNHKGRQWAELGTFGSIEDAARCVLRYEGRSLGSLLLISVRASLLRLTAFGALIFHKAPDRSFRQRAECTVQTWGRVGIGFLHCLECYFDTLRQTKS
jgi:hypothetical protein